MLALLMLKTPIEVDEQMRPATLSNPVCDGTGSLLEQNLECSTLSWVPTGKHEW